jgi:iron complex transport system permease protein
MTVTLRVQRRQRNRRRLTVTIVLAAIALGMLLLALCVGATFYRPDEVLRVLAGQLVPGASFTVGELRLPRALTGALAGLAFGLSGVTFQTMLRNPLASPDIIGITSGASAAAVFAILVLGLSGPVVSGIAVVAALAIAASIYLLARRGTELGGRLILIGIGVGAMLHALVSYLLLRADPFAVAGALRWLTGSLNDAFWESIPPLGIAVAVFGPILAIASRRLQVLELGEQTATSLGVNVDRTRLLLVLCAVGLAAFATAATGPIAFVAFLAGPIAARLVGPGASRVLPAALVGATLVLASDEIGQFAFDTRFPVGVVTGVLGAPFLIYLLIRTNRSGGSL